MLFRLLPRLSALLLIGYVVIRCQSYAVLEDGNDDVDEAADYQPDERRGPADDLYYDEEGEESDEDDRLTGAFRQSTSNAAPLVGQLFEPAYPAASSQTLQQYQPSPPTDYKPKRKKVFVPVFVPQKEKKKMKILTVNKGFYISGGSQMYGKFKSLKKCMKACAKTSSCFAGDYNPWLHKCYQHSNFTACSRQQSHPQFIHFSKVPCDVVDAPGGKITLGASMANGLESKGIDSLAQCIKKCATSGPGILASATLQAQVGNQACFAIDYDFATHKCYFFGANIITTASFFLHCIFSPANQPQPASQGTVPNPSVVHIQFCPNAAG